MKIYLAIPYSWNPEVSFKIANEMAAQLMSEGNTVFSPVSHTHPIADYLPIELKTDSHWWMAQDLPMVEWADIVYVVVIGKEGEELIRKSKGVMMEIMHAKKIGKPVMYSYRFDSFELKKQIL